MEKDFYIDQRWLASYCEKDWFDKIAAQNIDLGDLFEFPAFSPDWLYCPYHEKFAQFVYDTTQEISLHPSSLFEVGSALGRTFYEICKRMDSLREAVLLEPSQNFARTFMHIFEDENRICSIPVLRGNGEMTTISFQAEEVRRSCSKVGRKLINLPYEKVGDEVLPARLVLCSNVTDQCEDPEDLIEFLKGRTEVGGLLALSCTYQWNDKSHRKGESAIANINNMFKEGWTLIREANIDFRCRRSERHWMMFLSHVSAFQRHA